MSADFTALNARARGLRGHLFRRVELESLAAAGDVAVLARSLADGERIAAPLAKSADLAQVEASVRRASAQHLRLLARWCGDPPSVADVFEADEDRRSIRAMLRGAVQGAGARSRLAGLIPTRQLGERMLAQLAHLATVREVIAHLLAAGHPYAERLLPHAGAVQADLVDLERALIHACAERMRAGARRGDRLLRDYVRLRIDFDNAQTARMLSSHPQNRDGEACFVEGGRCLTRKAFVDAAGASPEDCSARLQRAFAGSTLRALFTRGTMTDVELETQLGAHLLRTYRRAARIDPLSSAPLIVFMLELQAQSRDLLRITHGAALALPAARVRAGLVTPWN